ncbi:outer membrane lipoprotein-sorting protein [Massilia sp. CCM 8734]|uniref:outer membrane lipoprotein-sorting protein n=1 Tax=Massilia sp. CCM 8734 TaxID=2609283 RepID=UPI001423CA37|nr:outer membrane lipoprotein-sorting protein [Massilia sp. CCM 8734]NHZ94196.1 outer membrane lipoprotein-sorting protein [Massilia sp. CCM 8734]
MCERRTVLAWALLAACAPARAGAPDANLLLAQSDAIRNPVQPFAVDVRLTEYRAGKQTDESSLNIYAKIDGASGQYRNLVRFARPLRDANKLMLVNGSDMWFFDPSSRAAVRISPQQRLLGRASSGDVVTANLARDYRAELVGDEQIQDGDVQARQCTLLNLAAHTKQANYHRVRLWLDSASRHPVKAEYYSGSGHLLKTVFYRRAQRVLGELRPTEAVIIDGTDASWITVMDFSGYVGREIPDSWFQRDYLPRFRLERDT